MLHEQFGAFGREQNTYTGNDLLRARAPSTRDGSNVVSSRVVGLSECRGYCGESESEETVDEHDGMTADELDVESYVGIRRS